MQELSYPSILMLVIVVPLIFFGALFYSFSKDFVRLFKKVILIYTKISVIAILIFTVIYFAVFINSVANVYNHYPNGFSSKTELEKEEIYNQYSYIKGIDFEDYKNNPVFLPFLDMFYFSSITYFTVGYGDITFIGVYRVLPILESFIGVAMTAIAISLSIVELTATSEDEELIKIQLYRGWDILNIIPITSSYRKITFINASNDTQQQTILYNKKLITFLEKLKIKWDFKETTNIQEYYYRFCLFLLSEFSNIYPSYMTDLLKIRQQKNNIDLNAIYLILVKIADIQSPDYNKIKPDIMLSVNNAIISLKEHM